MILYLHITEDSPRTEYLPAIKARLQSRIWLHTRGVGYCCTYCGGMVIQPLPAPCKCGAMLRGEVRSMTVAELFLAARMNGLRINMTWIRHEAKP